eukprot:10199561-Alexandrium_andersonii.AAC.1
MAASSWIRRAALAPSSFVARRRVGLAAASPGWHSSSGHRPGPPPPLPLSAVREACCLQWPTPPSSWTSLNGPPKPRPVRPSGRRLLALVVIVHSTSALSISSPACDP